MRSRKKFLGLVLCLASASTGSWAQPADILNAANNGDLVAQRKLGAMYLFGIEARLDKARGLQLLENSARAGDVRAQGLLGTYYLFEEKDHPKAIQWYQMAAEQNDSDAQLKLGILYQKGNGTVHPERSLYWYHRAVKNGSAGAESNLALMYFYGEGVSIDYQEAVKWAKSSAEKGMAVGQHLLGFAFYEGKGIPQNYMEAHRWFRRSAMQGHPVAQLMTGILLYEGQGVARNDEEAYFWLSLASAESAKYIELRDEVASKLTQQKIAHVQKRTKDWKPKLEADGQGFKTARKIFHNN